MDIFKIARSFSDHVPNLSRVPSDIISFETEKSAKEFANKVAPEYYTVIKQSEIDSYMPDGRGRTWHKTWMVYYQNYTPEQQKCAKEIVDKILTSNN